MCEFCNFKNSHYAKRFIDEDGHTTYLLIKNFGEEYTLEYAKTHESRNEANINFCPICGRRLKVENLIAKSPIEPFWKGKDVQNALHEIGSAVALLFPSEPISVAEQLINATYTREKGDMEKALHKAFGNNSDTVTENVYSVSELRQIAEHLLVYCNHNSEAGEL